MDGEKDESEKVSLMDIIRIPKEERTFKKDTTNEKKRRKKKIKHFLHFLCGGDSPVEAMELALGRNETQQKRIFDNLKGLIRSMDTPAIARYDGYMEVKTLTRLLIKCDFVRFLIRVLSMNPIDCLKPKIDMSWQIVHYYATSGLMFTFRDAESNEDFEEVMKSNTIETLLKNSFSENLYLAYQSLRALCYLCERTNEPIERIVFAGDLHKLGELVNKDTCHRKYLEVARNGYTHEYRQLMLDTHNVDKVHYHQIKVLGKDVQINKFHEVNAFLQMSYTYRKNAAVLLYKIADANERHRKLILKDVSTFKALYRWFKSPVITATDLEMFDQCALILSCMCLSEEIINTLFENYKFLKFVRIGLYLPERMSIYKMLDIVVRVCKFSKLGRLRLAQDKNVVQVLIQYLFSYNRWIQAYSFQAIAFMAGSPDTAKFLYTYGLRPEHICTLEKFYDSSELKDVISRLRRDLHRNCSRDWKCTIRDIESKSYFENFNHDRALLLKSNGNEFFKKENYLDAVMAYSSAIDHAPPALPKGTVFVNDKTVFRKYESKSWHVPAVLYSNRAQCFLKMKNWEKALDDCNEALARCLEDKEESKQLLLKTPFRRAKAFMELGDYHRALNDICVCLRRDKDNKVIQLLYKEILAKHRNHGGSEHIKRCGNCFGGEGGKVKRCANCKEVYCCRECQSQDWEVHQGFCTESNIEQ